MKRHAALLGLSRDHHLAESVLTEEEPDGIARKTDGRSEIQHPAFQPKAIFQNQAPLFLSFRRQARNLPSRISPFGRNDSASAEKGRPCPMSHCSAHVGKDPLNCSSAASRSSTMSCAMLSAYRLAPPSSTIRLPGIGMKTLKWPMLEIQGVTLGSDEIQPIRFPQV